MSDIAQLGFSVDTSDLNNAKASLEALVPAAAKVESATDRVNKAFGDTASAADRAARGFGSNASSATAAGAAMESVANTANKTATAVNSMARANFNGAGGFDILTGKANATFGAINSNMSKLGMFEKGMKDVGGAVKFSAQEGLNFTRQMSDIGVTLAMGMNPLMIAIQQGPQLFDIMKTAGMRAGVGIGAVFRAAGVVIWTALAPILPIVLAIAAGVAIVAGAFALVERSFNKGNENIAAGMGLTEKQLKRVAKAGEDTGITLKDTFFGFFDVVGDRLMTAFDGPLKWLKTAWNDTLDFITEYAGKSIKFTVGVFVGAVYGIIASWKLLPGAIGDAAISAANMVISAVEWMINKAIAGLNWLIDKADAAAALVGMDGIGRIADVSMGRVDNPFAGQGKAAGAAFATGFQQGMKDTGSAVDRFMVDWASAARKRAQDRIRAAAGDAEKGPKDKKGGKTEGEKFEDIVAGGERDLAMLNAKIEGVNLSAEASLRLANMQKLVNEATEKGITLDKTRLGILSKLADELTDAQIKLKNLEGFKEISQGADKQLAQLKAAHDQIGLYGEALAFAQYHQELLNQATEKGIILNEDQLAGLNLKALAMARQSTANAHDQFWEGIIKKAEMDQFMLERQRGELGLTGAALAAYRYETDLLAEAKQKNIDLSPAEIAAIHASADAYGQQAEALAKTAEMLAFKKDTIKGFFKDFTDGLREGKTLWESFADAATRALDRIIDKMLDQAFDAAVNAIIKIIMSTFSDGGVFGGSGASGFAKGGAFANGGVQAFASGGAFTNGVYDSPTLFAFANGGALGVMGEAGPEAVMPLHRGPDGSLGVQMHGAGRGASNGAPVVNVNITNNHTLKGAVSSQDVIELNKRTAEQTKQELRLQIPDIINQFNRDGALA